MGDYLMKTTLNKIRAKSPCKSGWETLLSSLGKTQADDDELALLTILDSNGVEDAVWCLRAVEGHDAEILAFARFCAKQNIEAIKSYTDENSYNLVIEWLDGGDESIKSAAESAAWLVARATDRSTAWSAARAAAWSAARSVIESAALSAAWSAAWSAARSAADSSARSAADSATWSAADSSTRSAAWSAARSAAWSAQETELRRILVCDNSKVEFNFIEEAYDLINKGKYLYGRLFDELA
jgi:hypothetical protein